MAKDGGRVATTCVGFDEGWNDELAGAAATARRLGTDHRGVRIAPICDDAVVDAIDALDEPLADPSVVPTYHVSRVARESVVVALSGDGGDEAFGGYDFRYTPHDIESRLRPLARRFASGATLNRMARATGVRALGNLARDGVDAYFADLCFADGENVGAVLGRPTLDLRDGFAYGAVASSYRRCRSDDPVQRAMFADVKGYLADDVLVKVDRMSMRHGLEVRCPLLDHRIVELAFAIPAARKRSWRESKRLLRRVAARHLPPAIVAGAKRGFGAPTRDWLRRLCADRFRDEVLAPGAECAAVADMAAVRARFDAHLHGRADHAHLLWALWIFERWRRRRRRADVETSAA
jgi:asparagine synthase (glutamine-hydrolysing)